MAALKLVFAALALVAATPAQADPIARWRLHIAEASARFGIPEAWIERVMRAESGGRTTLSGRPIRSRAGAMGLMQLMPGTWAEMRRRLDLGRDPHDPRDNILAGTAYLRLMHEGDSAADQRAMDRVRGTLIRGHAMNQGRDRDLLPGL